jgi:hypothetical protein
VKEFWEKYWKWSDKVNKPFQKHKKRIVLYVVLCQSVLVTAALFSLVNGNNKNTKLIMICRPDISGEVIVCIQEDTIEYGIKYF